jgi:hypothetical protein
MIVITPPARSAIGRGNVVDSGEPIRVVARGPFSRHSQSRERVEVVQGSPRDAAIVDHALTRGDSVCRLAVPVPDAEGAARLCGLPAVDNPRRFGERPPMTSICVASSLRATSGGRCGSDRAWGLIDKGRRAPRASIDR